MFVPNFKILSQVVSEKSLTEKKFTDRQKNKHPYGKGKNYIPAMLYTSYTGDIMIEFQPVDPHSDQHLCNSHNSTSSFYMSPVVRKLAFCICENKDADQLCGNHKADQRLCFRYTDTKISLLGNLKKNEAKL